MGIGPGGANGSKTQSQSISYDLTTRSHPGWMSEFVVILVRACAIFLKEDHTFSS